MTIARNHRFPRRLLPTVLAFGLALAMGLATAQDSRLPDIGSSAGNVLSPAKQAEYGAMVLAQLRHEGYILEDPLLDGWLRDVGQRLAGASDRPQQSFTFFLLRDRQINAFATLGGYIGMNAGLILSAEREDEMAGVLAHEIAHVELRHSLRQIVRSAGLRVVVAALFGDYAALGGWAAQLGELKFSRDAEREADRHGLQRLAEAHIAPRGLLDFFRTLARQDGSEKHLPALLSTHPASAERSAWLEAAIAAAPHPAVQPLAIDWAEIGRQPGRTSPGG